MLVGELWASKSTQSKSYPQQVEHTAYIYGQDIVKQNKDCYKHVGYCPQFDALSKELTGRQTLQLYCWLRGVTGDKCNAFVDDLLNALGLTYKQHEPVGNYSMGMSRRLSIGVAITGMFVFDASSSCSLLLCCLFFYYFFHLFFIILFAHNKGDEINAS